MRYVIIRCEDDAPGGKEPLALLKGAKTAHLQHLAQAGAAGTIRPREPLVAIDRFQLHRALFGLTPDDQEASAGRCYAASVNRQLAPEETAWCCELVTHQDGRIIDPTAGDIPTKESEILIQGLGEHLGSETRRWEVGHGSHHVLIARDAALGSEGEPPVRSPELLIGQVWRRHLPQGPVGQTLQSVIEQASKFLEDHPVNRVRVDLGENPANLLWLWGAGGASAQKTFTERTQLSGAVVSASFLMRGFARSFGLGWKDGPASLEGPSLKRLMTSVASLIDRHDLVYVHVRVDTADPVERLCAMERLDSLLIKPLTETLPRLGPWRLLFAIDDRGASLVPFVAIGTGLAQQPIATLTAERFAESPLAFEDAAEMFPWFTAPLASSPAGTGLTGKPAERA